MDKYNIILKIKEQVLFDIIQKKIIKKAQETPPPPSKKKARVSLLSEPPAGTSEPPAAALNKRPSLKSGIYPSNIVKEMQKAMQKLSQTVVHDMESAGIFKTPADTEFELSGAGERKSKKAFFDFMVGHFMNELPKGQVGKEWRIKPGTKEKSTTGIYESNIVMETIKRIGKSSNDFIIDGIWGWKTQNSLLNIRGFSYALLQMETQLGLDNPKIYTTNDLQNFTDDLGKIKVVENKVILPKDKDQLAAKIIVYLNKITLLYTDFRVKVTTQPEYRTYIEGDMPFISFNERGTNPDTLTDNEIENIKNKFIILQNTKFLPNNTKMPLMALLNKDEYIKWAKAVDPRIKDDNNAIGVFLHDIKPLIDKGELGEERDIPFSTPKPLPSINETKGRTIGDTFKRYLEEMKNRK